MKARLRRLFGEFIDVYSIKSYSQEGEDLVLWRMFNHQNRGFYVDVGAHHPLRFSNTHFFYKRGWHGINIEPRPDAMRAFRRHRVRDTNLELGVSARPGVAEYFLFDEPALNTFDRALAEARVRDTAYKLVMTKEIPVERLDAILERYLPAGQSIDFLNIDVEGLDFAVVKSNDWSKYRPKYVLVELLNTSVEAAGRSELSSFMCNQGYELSGKTFNTLIFAKR